MNQSSKSAQWLHSPTSMTRVVSFVHPEMNEPRDSNEFVTSLNECQRYLPSMNPSIQVSRLNEPSDLNEYQTPKLSRLWIMNDSQQSAIRTIELINGPVFWTNSRNGMGYGWVFSTLLNKTQQWIVSAITDDSLIQIINEWFTWFSHNPVIGPHQTAYQSFMIIMIKPICSRSE